jgi:hypothetical protein
MKTSLAASIAIVLSLLCPPAGAHADEAAAKESPSMVEKCAVVAKDDAGKVQMIVMPELHLASLPADAEFILPANSPKNVEAISCGRESIVPVLGDERVLAAHLPLFIVSDERVGILTMVEGRLRFELASGKMTDAEADAAQKFLNAAQLKLQD